MVAVWFASGVCKTAGVGCEVWRESASRLDRMLPFGHKEKKNRGSSREDTRAIADLAVRVVSCTRSGERLSRIRKMRVWPQVVAWRIRQETSTCNTWWLGEAYPRDGVE